MTTTILTNNDLERRAPSIFAQLPSDRVSGRYQMIPTVGVVDALRGAGWEPTFAAQSRAKDPDRGFVQRHVVRFRHPDMQPYAIDSLFPELVLVNSHDGSSAYQLHAGLFRLVCGNGLIVADATFTKLSIRHSGRAAQDVIDASYRVVEDVPKIVGAVDEMRGVELLDGEREVFADSAALLRWEPGHAPVEARKLLTPRRPEDGRRDLWTTFNVVQENLVRGGLSGRTASGRRHTTRGVKSVDADTKLNKALWHLATEMGRIKTEAPA